jgi:hypothetical protein
MSLRLIELTTYLDRENEERLELLQDGVLVVAGAVTKVVLRFGEFCVDSDVDTDVIYFLDSDKQVLCLRLGLTADLVVGKYKKGTLTVWDSLSEFGIAWAEITVVVKPWAVCPV